MDKTLADYIHRVSEEMKKPKSNTDTQDSSNRYPVFPENMDGYDLPNNPYSEV